MTGCESALKYNDPLSPSAPSNPYFDQDQQAWVFSRYADVMAALHEPDLWPVPARKKKNLKVPDEASLHALRACVLEAFSSARLHDWQRQIERAAAQLASGGPIDLVAGFAEPLCVESAEIVTGSSRADRVQLVEAARIVSRAASEPFDEGLRVKATQADARLELYFQESQIPMAGPTFVALSRTLAGLLANGWFALLRHPDELARLRKDSNLIPRAIEEMLRYACVPQSVFRHASRALTLRGVRIDEGARLTLQVASANRDPLQFAHPDRFNAGRREASHLSLGFGLHSCVGGALIRMAAGAATRAFVEAFGGCRISGLVEWHGGTGFRSLATLPIQ